MDRPLDAGYVRRQRTRRLRGGGGLGAWPTPGPPPTPGEPILDLDVSESRLAYEQLVERVALKRNEEKQKRLGPARTLADLKGQAAGAASDGKGSGVRLGQMQQ